jgi:hypothetical protein
MSAAKVEPLPHSTRYPSSLLGCLAIFLNRGIAISVCRAHVADILKGKKVSRVRVSKGERLQERVKELEEKLANSVPNPSRNRQIESRKQDCRASEKALLLRGKGSQAARVVSYSNLQAISLG